MDVQLRVSLILLTTSSIEPPCPTQTRRLKHPYFLLWDGFSCEQEALIRGLVCNWSLGNNVRMSEHEYVSLTLLLVHIFGISYQLRTETISLSASWTDRLPWSLRSSLEQVSPEIATSLKHVYVIQPFRITLTECTRIPHPSQTSKNHM